MANIFSDDDISIEKLQLGPFGTNAYILICRRTNDSLVVDAPAEANAILENLKGTNPRYILMTHHHMDHTGALPELKARLKIPLASHAADAQSLPVQPEHLLNDGDTVSFGNIVLEVRHTPGHTAGSLCFKTGKYLLSGDTLSPAARAKQGQRLTCSR